MDFPALWKTLNRKRRRPLRKRYAAAARGFLVVLVLPVLVWARPAAAVFAGDEALQDLYFGEALYHAYQEDWFAAISRLEVELAQHYALDEPSRDALSVHRYAAEFDIGDIELRYRMHQRASQAIKSLLEAEKVPRPVRNDAAYRLARIYYEKGYYVNAIHALDLIQGEVRPSLADRADLLRAQAQMTQGNYDTAVELLRPLRGNDGQEGYATFNLGVALLRAGQLQRGAETLESVGEMSAGSREMVALRDKANLTLGNRLMEEGYPGQARPYLERVRLQGPFSNKALLLAGWADAAREAYKKALVPWSELHGRDATDPAVQEALLALPYAYAQLEVFGRAALLYGEAVNEFDKEIDRLDASIASILDGKLREALLQDAGDPNSEFFDKLRRVPDAPETRYLLELMAGHDFQESVKNYRDMESLRRKTLQWQADIQAYQDLIDRRRAYYEPLLPQVENDFEIQDGLMESALLRRDEVAQRLKNAQQARDTRAFATQGELTIQRRLDRLAYRLSRMQEQPGLARTKARLARLQGVLDWRLHTDYEQRLAAAHQHLSELDELIEKLEQQHERVLRMKRAAYQSFEGYRIPLRRANTKLNTLNRRIQGVMQQQARYLEKVAVRVLDGRRKKLVDYRVKARFALAESYDRATKKQAEEAEEQLRKQRQQIQEQQIEEEDAGPATPADDQAQTPPEPAEPEIQPARKPDAGASATDDEGAEATE